MGCRLARIFATALTIVALSACSGGGSGPAGTTSPGGGPPTVPQRAAVSVSLFVPAAKSRAASRAVSTAGVQRLKPLYVPASVNSVTIRQTESAGSPVANAPIVLLVIGGSDCTQSAGGQTCTATLQGALGQDSWAFASYVAGNGSGTTVSVNTGTLLVLSGAANVLSLTLNPILAALAFVPLAYSANATTTSVLPVVLQAMDLRYRGERCYSNHAFVVVAGHRASNYDRYRGYRNGNDDRKQRSRADRLQWDARCRDAIALRGGARHYDGDVNVDAHAGRRRTRGSGEHRAR